MALNTLNTGNGFLTFFNTVTPLLYITAETDSAADFDQVTLQKWRDGGFDVNFPLYGDDGASYTNALKNISRGLGVGDSFAVIAYGDAAAVALDVFRGGMARLVALVSYYPTTIPDPSATFLIGIKVLVHLAAGTVVWQKFPESNAGLLRIFQYHVDFRQQSLLFYKDLSKDFSRWLRSIFPVFLLRWTISRKI